MGFLSFWRRPQPASSGRADPQWHRDGRTYFPRLLGLDLDAAGTVGHGGVYVIWHRGFAPEWVYVGWAEDLGRSIDAAREHPHILDYEVHGGLYVTWSPVRAEFRQGVALYLRQALKPSEPQPMFDDAIDPAVAPVPVLAPR